MSKTILVVGHGPGISDAVARRFGAEGYKVALVARNAARLEKAASELRALGIEAQGFDGDVSDPAGVTALVARVESTLGPLSIIHWNAYSSAAGDLLASSAAELRTPIDVSTTSLLAAVQAALPSLRAQKGAVLVTGGGFAFYDPAVDAMATQFGAMGLAVSKAAQHKLVGLLAERLRADGIYVGEVVVTGLVKGTAFDHGSATLEPKAIAEKFWSLLSERSTTTAIFG